MESKQSKQADAKFRQEWQKHGPTCATCVRFKSNKKTIRSAFGGEYIEEKNIRCSLGGFSTGKSSWCKEYKAT